MPNPVDALRVSVERLHALAANLSDDQLDLPAYPSEWTIAHVLSHLGSGADIFKRRLDDEAAGLSTPPEFNQSVWDSWNAKSPREQANDFLVSDRALLDAIDTLPDDQRSSLKFSLGPMSFDFYGYVSLRLNEHAVHAWDVEVALDPGAVIPEELADSLVDNLELAVRFTAKSKGVEHLIHLETTAPQRHFALVVGDEGVTLGASDVTTADVVMPAEALVRLVYGRLDPEHTPPIAGSIDLEQLRETFPGM